MPPSKLEQVERLTRALVAREAELRANEEIVKRATFRSTSLRAAIADLRATLAALIGDDATAEAPPLPPMVHGLTGAPESGQLPSNSGGTILKRITAYLETEPRAFEALEIAQQLGIRDDVVRTSLSKLYARGRIARPVPGAYCSLLHVEEVAASLGERNERRR
jgi:hypothetical protein